MTTTTIDLTAVTNNRVYGNNATYLTARSTSAVVDTYMTVGQTTGFLVFRAPLKFDTSSIPDTDVISQVNMNLAVVTDTSTTDFDLAIVKYDWSASDPLAAGTREAIYDGILAATADDNIWRNTNGIDVNTYYTSGNLSPAWVNKTGITYYGLISAEDIAASQPAGAEYVTLDKTTKVPQLVIVHYSIIESSVSGAISSIVGVVGKSTAKPTAGAISTLTGTAVKSTSKSFTGALSSIVGTTIKSTGKSLAGALSSIAGTLASAPIWGKVLSGAIDTIVGDLVRQTQKIAAGGITPAGTVIKAIAVSMTGAISTLVGTLTKQISKAFAGTISTITGALTKMTGKILAGALSSISGTLAALATIISSLTNHWRTLTIKAEARTMSIVSEDRTLDIDPENRKLATTRPDQEHL